MRLVQLVQVQRDGLTHAGHARDRHRIDQGDLGPGMDRGGGHLGADQTGPDDRQVLARHQDLTQASASALDRTTY